MKYSTEVTINRPRQQVVELFDNPELMPKWQKGFISMAQISGEPGQAGAKANLVYDMNGRKIEMVETIITRSLPDEFTATYEAKGVHNVVANRFYEDGPDKTRWVMANEFNFTGFMKLIGMLMPGSFRKQTLDDMNRFKAFAESA